MKKTAAVIGATGLVGREILNLLLQDERYEKVLVYARHKPEVSHEKLDVKLGDLLKDEIFSPAIPADEIFCAIGTTQSKSPDLATYKQVDYGIPVRTASFGLKGGMKRYLVVSALGADAGSKMFYPRIKGMMEKALKKMAIPRLHIFRPSLILGSRQEFRFGETIAGFFVKALKPVIPSKYRGVKASDIARAMVETANSAIHSSEISSQDIVPLSRLYG